MPALRHARLRAYGVSEVRSALVYSAAGAATCDGLILRQEADAGPNFAGGLGRDGFGSSWWRAEGSESSPAGGPGAAAPALPKGPGAQGHRGGHHGVGSHYGAGAGLDAESGSEDDETEVCGVVVGGGRLRVQACDLGMFSLANLFVNGGADPTIVGSRYEMHKTKN